MMLAGWDEPKTGAFAYLHLLSRLAIIAAVVGLFYLDDLWTWIRARKDLQRSELRRRLLRYLKFNINAPFTRFVYTFTIMTVVGCLVAIAVSFLITVGGGAELYRNLVILAGVLAVWVITADVWQRRR